MAGYRLYLRDSVGVVGRDDFEAPSDVAALRIAVLVWDACSDECDRYEVWQGERWVAAGQKNTARPPIAATEIAAKTRESLIAREEAIQNSRWAVARSRRLLERLSALKSHP